MHKKYLNQRRFKKGLRNLEKDLGNTLMADGTDASKTELAGKLDFWVSYYVTWLFQNTKLPEDVWCDGVVWNNERCSLKFQELAHGMFSLECELDILDDKSSSTGELSVTFEFCQKFKKFIKYEILLSIDTEKYVFSS